MRNETLAIIAAVSVGIAFAAGLGSSTLLRGSTSSVSCIIMAEGEIVLQVLDSTTGKPIGSAPVHAQFLAPECPPNPRSTVSLNMTMTNSTGYVIIGGEVGQYYMQVDNSGYPVTVTIVPERATCVTLSLPSGEIHITYSATFQFSC